MLSRPVEGIGTKYPTNKILSRNKITNNKIIGQNIQIKKIKKKKNIIKNYTIFLIRYFQTYYTKTYTY